MSEIINEGMQEAHKIIDEAAEVGKKGLRLIEGGKSGSDTGFRDDIPWLLSLEVGTAFLIKDVTNVRNFNLGQFNLVRFTDNKLAALLYTAMLGQTEQAMWVDPVQFCNQYRLVANLGVIVPQAQQQEETTDGNNQGSVQS